MADKFGTGAPIQFKTGTIAKLEIDDSVAKDVGTVYFAVDTTNEKGKIYFDASNDLRIPMAVYTVATTSEDGLMSADDKAKLDAHDDIVKQTLNRGTDTKPLLFSYANTGNVLETVDEITYRNDDFYVTPSEQLLVAPKVGVTNTAYMTYNTEHNAIDFIIK